jgi:hypothetical protein
MLRGFVDPPAVHYPCAELVRLSGEGPQLFFPQLHRDGPATAIDRGFRLFPQRKQSLTCD